MGKVIIHGGVTDPEEIAKVNMVTPLGPFAKRDGKQVICLTLPPQAAPPRKRARRKPKAQR